MSRVVNDWLDDETGLEIGLFVAHTIGEDTFRKYWHGDAETRQWIDEDKYTLYHMFQRPFWKKSVTIDNL